MLVRFQLLQEIEEVRRQFDRLLYDFATDYSNGIPVACCMFLHHSLKCLI